MPVRFRRVISLVYILCLCLQVCNVHSLACFDFCYFFTLVCSCLVCSNSLYIFNSFIFYSSMDLKKYAVLVEMAKNSDVLFSTSRLHAVCKKRDEAWDLISKFGHGIELTDSLFSRQDFRVLVTRWKGVFRVRESTQHSCAMFTNPIHVFPVCFSGQNS